MSVALEHEHPFPTLEYASDIAQQIPCLREVIRHVAHDTAVMQLLAESHESLTEVTDYLRPSAKVTVRLALEVALLAHHGQARRSGEPFVTHPVAVAVILAKNSMEKETIVSGLLHDTVEDTPLTFADIERVFGADVRKIVEGETKVSKLPKMVRTQMADEGLPGTDLGTSKVQEQVENMRSMFIAMADDWRIVVVKLADRLHNMRTLQYMPVEKRASIARETLEIFAPLAHRLGMWQFKTELSDLSFKYLFPNEYNSLDSVINSKFREYQLILDNAKQQLTAELQADPWLQGRMRSVHVVGRTKSIYSTFKKMQRHECGIERIFDLVALRVVLTPEPEEPASVVEGTVHGVAAAVGPGGDLARARASNDAENAMCYHVLGKVHSKYTPLPRTLKDYISSPKPNGYRSLHTTVLVGTQPLEVQIRTQAMHHIAEHGAAAHWAYKDGVASLPWLQIIREWQVQVDSAHDFMQLVRQELLGTRVFVFTANGRILNLARGATLMDAAKDLALPVRGYVPILNGKAALHTTELSNGDIVAFEKSSLLLVDKLGSRGYAADLRQRLNPNGGGGTDGSDDGVRLSLASAGGGYGGYRGSSAFNPRNINDASGGFTGGVLGEAAMNDLKERAMCYLQDRERSGAGWSVCPHCQPLPGDDLVATHMHAAEWDEEEHNAPPEARVQGTLHTGECPELLQELERGRRLVANPAERAAEFHEALDRHRVSARDRGLSASVIVFCTDRKGMLVDVATVVTSHANNIMNVQTDVYTPGGTSAFKYTVTVESRQQLEELIGAVQQVPDVTRVMRGTDYGPRTDAHDRTRDSW